MGFFSKIGNSISKTVKAVSKDIVPIAAAVATGGTSLAFMPPSNVMGRLDKATGLPVSSIASMVTGGGQPAQQTVSETVATQATITPPMLPQQQSSVYDQITPYLNSFLQSSQQRSNDVSPNANILASQPVQQTAPRSNMMLIIGAVLAVAVGGFFLFRRK